MKILFLEHLLPLPLDSGGKIKSLCALKALASRHEVRVVSYVRSEIEERAIPELRAICPRVDVVPMSRSGARQATDLLASLALGRSFIVSRDFRQGMLDVFRRAASEFRPDVVHIDHLQMAQFVDFSGPYRTVLDQHNVESTIIRRIAQTSLNPGMRLYAGIEWPKLLRHELDMCRRSDLVLTVSEEDKAALQAHDPSLEHVRSVPIGVDVGSTPVVQRQPGSRNVLFLGTMHWPPNIDCVLHFHNEILPLVRREIPDVTFTIAGQRPPGSITGLAPDPAVCVTGYVSDAGGLAAECGVFVVPLRSGSGVRVKILNAMAMGLPVVSTSVGAEGLEAVHGEHILIADTPGDFARAVVNALTDSSLAAKLGEKGRGLVEQMYSLGVVGRRLLALYDEHFGACHSSLRSE